jgi:hypothetical protein
MNQKEFERLQDLDDAFNSLKLTHGHFGAEVIIALQIAKNTVEKLLHDEIKKKQEK